MQEQIEEPLLADYQRAEFDGDQANERRPLFERQVSSSSRTRRPWYRRPSPYWLVPGALIMSTSMGSIISPKIEIYNMLVCRAIAPSRPMSAHKLSSADQSTLVEWPSIASTSNLEATEGQPWLLLGSGMDQESCRKNSKVQRYVSELSLGLTLSMGILSALTAGFWGSLSDRKGRKPILALTQVGFLCADVVFLTVVLFNDVLPYRLLFLGPAIDGLFGGFATASACFGAYISDCTPQGSRANVFGLLMALIFAGLALGPTVGALFIDLTGTVLAPFYAAMALHLIHIFGIALILPESRSTAMLASSQERHEAEVKAAAEGAPSMWTRGKQNARAVLVPLTVFLPREVEDVPDDQRAILRPIARRSWALTMTGIAYAFGASIMGIYTVKMQYAQFAFGWGPQENGYLLSLAGVARALVLVVVLPLITKLFRSKPPSVESKEPGASDFEVAEQNHAVLRVKLLHDSHFDLVLARGAFAFDLIGYSMIVAATTPLWFIIGSAVTAFGIGGGPALQSLALTLSSRDDSGRVLAALSVLSTLTGSIAGPVLFNAVFVSTLDVWPRTVFVVCAALFAAALVCCAFVRLARRSEVGEALRRREA